MRKMDEKERWFASQRRILQQRREARASGKKRQSIIQKKITKAHEDMASQNEREKLRKSLYRKRKFPDPPLIVKFDKEFGLEEEKGVDYFLKQAASFIDFRAKLLELDITNCHRIWPSGIVLLCSLKQWVELRASRKNPPTIRSTPSNNAKLNSYLGHCGFYDYVGRTHDEVANYYSNKDIVKITRERRKETLELRESQILVLLEQFSGLDEQELEWFNSVILTEVFNNVTEHGISQYDKGWWLLAQRHNTHGIISLCIVDNGIGIRHSLMTGPQRNEIEKRISNSPENDGDFIKLAIEENVSGAIEAPLRSGRLMKSYEKGARRGHGLKRIKKLAKCWGFLFPFYPIMGTYLYPRMVIFRNMDRVQGEFLLGLCIILLSEPKRRRRYDNRRCWSRFLPPPCK